MCLQGSINLISIDQVSSKFIWYIIAFLVLVAIIAGIIFYTMKMMKKTKKMADDQVDDMQPIIGDSAGDPKAKSQY